MITMSRGSALESRNVADRVSYRAKILDCCLREALSSYDWPDLVTISISLVTRALCPEWPLRPDSSGQISLKRRPGSPSQTVTSKSIDHVIHYTQHVGAPIPLALILCNV